MGGPGGLFSVVLQDGWPRFSSNAGRLAQCLVVLQARLACVQ